MKKIITKSLFIYMLIALFITIGAIFALQTVVTRRANNASSQNKLADVKEKLASNDENIERLKENLRIILPKQEPLRICLPATARSTEIWTG